MATTSRKVSVPCRSGDHRPQQHMATNLARAWQAEIACGTSADQPSRHLATQEIVELGKEADLIAETRSRRFQCVYDGDRDLFRIARGLGLVPIGGLV